MQQPQKIGLTALTALVFSSMVGAGIFSLPQNMAQVAGVDAILTGLANANQRHGPVMPGTDHVDRGEL